MKRPSMTAGGGLATGLATVTIRQMSGHEATLSVDKGTAFHKVKTLYARQLGCAQASQVQLFIAGDEQRVHGSKVLTGDISLFALVSEEEDEEVAIARNDAMVDHAVLDHAEDVARLIDEDGADPDWIKPFTNDERTPVHTAVYNGKFEMAQLLLVRGADPNLADRSHSRTPLMEACAQGQTQAARLLLAHRADPNAAEKGGNTALMRAARQGSLGTVRLLLDHGADAAAEDVFGKTALDWILQVGSDANDEMLLIYNSAGRARTRSLF
jgi:hypothetical protein